MKEDGTIEPSDLGLKPDFNPEVWSEAENLAYEHVAASALPSSQRDTRAWIKDIMPDLVRGEVPEEQSIALGIAVLQLMNDVKSWQQKHVGHLAKVKELEDKLEVYDATSRMTLDDALAKIEKKHKDDK